MAVGRNKTPLVGWHPSAGLVAWLDEETERRGGGRGVRSAILEEALAAYKQALEPGTIERQRRISDAACDDAVRENEEPVPKPKNCKHPNLKLSKGVCPDCFTYVESKPAK